MLPNFICFRCGADFEFITKDDTPHWQELALCTKCTDSFLTEKSKLLINYSLPEQMITGLKLFLQGLQKAYPTLVLDNEHFAKTPYRVARMFIELCQGLNDDPVKSLGTQFNEPDYKGIVVVNNISFNSLCAHHLAVFRGKAHVGYLPNDKVVGLSKINRLVEVCALRPTVQEQLTQLIADTLEQGLTPHGVCVVLEANHDCVAVRGVRSKGSVTKTSVVTGRFLSNINQCRDEFFRLIQNNNTSMD